MFTVAPRACIASMNGSGLPVSPLPAPVHSPAPVSVHAVSEDVQAAGEKALAHFIGPMARVLTKRAARQATCPDDFRRLLAEHLSSPVEKADFLRRLQK